MIVSTIYDEVDLKEFSLALPTFLGAKALDIQGFLRNITSDGIKLQKFDVDLLFNFDIIKLNIKEFNIQFSNSELSLNTLLDRGVNIIITYGEKGLRLLSKTQDLHVPLRTKKVLDSVTSVGAGDRLLSSIALAASKLKRNYQGHLVLDQKIVSDAQEDALELV